MTRGFRLVVPALFLLLAVNVGESVERPNIVIVLADDLGWADLGCYGADLHETPHLDRLASQGVRFTDAYSAAPICSPTRASILTGKFPARLNMTIWREGAVRGPVTRDGLTTPVSATNLPFDDVTLAEALRDAGYFTAHLGKWHLGDAENYAESHGFDVEIGGTLWGAPPTFFYPYRGGFGNGREFRYVPRLEWGQEGEYLTDRLTDEAILVIDKVRDRPFFLYLAHYAVHTPIEARPADVQHYQAKLRDGLSHKNATYAAMLHSLDEGMGKLLAKLDELQIADRTLVVFCSDNGGFINDYKGQPVTSNHPLRSGKGSLYEGGIRIPFLIRGPGAAAGATCSEPVFTCDLYATCLELAGATGNAEHDGVNLLPLLKDPQAKLGRESLYFHYPHFYQTTSPVSALRKGPWKLLHYYQDGHDELFDLSADLSEATDLAASQSGRAKELRQELDGWLKSVGAHLPQRTTSAR